MLKAPEEYWGKSVAFLVQGLNHFLRNNGEIITTHHPAAIIIAAAETVPILYLRITFAGGKLSRASKF